MKRLLVLLAPLLFCGSAFAAQENPKHVRISIQYFSLTLGTLNELLADENVSDSLLHDKVTALAKIRKAELLESNMIVCRSGEKAVVDSIREEIYPTEYDPGDGLGSNQPPFNPAEFKPSVRPTDWMMGTFETRNTGMTLEVQPTLASPTLVNLRLVPEFVALPGFTTWVEHTDRWGKADIRMPVFETWRTNTNVSLKSGKFALVSSITPKRPLPVPFVETRILLFVRADVLGSVLE